ncbi:carboxypeptidase-like regulatory domain-containing protein [Paludibaculum fermentans]|uniref:Carboxypeptidase regulatory-like domain-containing protein n=1 Tax=Paludibaculum fermentans TaxID=1473598 RepID=A0A7S7SKF2_PALFE|nr:carboxypeptidase-like regulatory domain-containing protein [Paludibaculum fermentans]QOY87396.1 carboxypeptidase regulatory-like domain-containing protein [Paludibaculum fermentans]
MFRDRPIRALHISAEEERALAPLELEAGLSAGCDALSLDLRDGILLAAGTEAGALAGAVVNRKDKPIANVAVELSCEEDRICGQTRTNAKGEFLFRGLKPGHYSVIAKGARHYSLTKEGFVVRAGLRLVYGSIELESCGWGDCNPAHRRKDPKFLGQICED